MLRRRDLSVVGQGAGVPQHRDTLGGGGEVADVGLLRQMLQRALVDRRQRLGQALEGGRRLDRAFQRVEAGEIEGGGAPLQHLHRLEIVALDLLDEVVGERIDLPGDAEGAVAQMPAGPAGDLAEFGGGEVAELEAVELAVLGEGDMVDIEVEAHADGIGGDEVVHVARLVERHLRVAGAGAQRTHDDGRTAALATDQFADRIDLVGREGDDGRTARQARDLLLAGIGKVRHARPGYRGDALQEPFQNAAHGGGAEQQRFLPPAQIEDAVGEDVPALEVAGELDLVDGNEGGVRLARHRLDRADGEARIGRRDLLLARVQRDVGGADLFDHTPIDLARKQAERQPDHPALMRHHPLDGEMRLASVGRPEDGGHVAPRRHGLGVRHDLEIHLDFERLFDSERFWGRPSLGSAFAAEAATGRPVEGRPGMLSTYRKSPPVQNSKRTN